MRVNLTVLLSYAALLFLVAIMGTVSGSIIIARPAMAADVLVENVPSIGQALRTGSIIPDGLPGYCQNPSDQQVKSCTELGACYGSPGACKEYRALKAKQKKVEDDYATKWQDTCDGRPEACEVWAQSLAYDRQVKPGSVPPHQASKFKSVEADNGGIYDVELNSVRHLNNGNAEAYVIPAHARGDRVVPLDLMFDCHGHYMDLRNSFGATVYAAPHSVVGEISAIACASGKS